MLVYSSENFNPKRNGHGYEYYSRDAICGCCGKVIGKQICYEYEQKEKEYFFENREINYYKFCPYCGNEINTKQNKLN